MLMMSFLPRNSANDTGRPSAADGSASVGNASPALNPCGRGALRSQIGFGFGWPAAPAPRAAAETAVESSQMTLALMTTSWSRLTVRSRRPTRDLAELVGDPRVSILRERRRLEERRDEKERKHSVWPDDDSGLPGLQLSLEI